MVTYELTDKLLTSSGWAYLFDLSALAESGDESEVNEQIRRTCLTAATALTKARSKKVKKGPFIIWHALSRVTNDQNQPNQATYLSASGPGTPRVRLI